MIGQAGNIWAMFQRFDSWLHSGSIRRQTGQIFNLFALLVLVLGAVSTIGTVRIEQRSAALSNLTDVAFLTANMTRQVTLSKDNMGAYRARGYELELIELSIAQARNAVEMNSKLAGYADSFDSHYLNQVTSLDADLRNIEVLLGEVRDAPRDVVGQEAFLGPRYDALDTTIKKVVALREDAAGRVATYSGEGRAEIQILIAALITCGMVALGLVFLGKRLVANRVTDPITQISQASDRIANGETQLELPGSDRADEIGVLVSALNTMQQAQRDTAELAQREHEREIARQQEAQRERDESRRQHSELLQTLADQFEETVSDVATEVATASNQMHSAAIELSKHVDASSASVSEANSSLKDASVGITGAAAASDEFALSISEVSHQATTSSQSARKAADAVGNANDTVAALTGAADRISQIIEVIAGIANRTNLLALNASIEAARGGESGRGFAVVASEVKELAIQTGRATQEVEVLIHQMQESTGDSVSALALVAEQVIAVETTATSIAAAVDQQAVAGQDLAQSIDMAARNTRSVSETVDGVDQVSLISGATASEVQASSANLTSQAALLREQVSAFLREVRAA